MTFAEMNAPTGEWKSVLAAVLFGLSVTGWIAIWIKLNGNVIFVCKQECQMIDFAYGQKYLM